MFFIILEKMIIIIMNTNVTSEKAIKENKNNLIEKRKAEIKNSELKAKSILDLDLDKLDNDNLLDLLSKSKLKVEKESNERFKMYKFETLELTEKEEKRKRTKIRKQRNKLIDNILYYFSNKKEKDLKDEIKLFNSFYKENYILNDYSLKSIASDNSDKDTKEKITFMFEIIKRTK